MTTDERQQTPKVNRPEKINKSKTRFNISIFFKEVSIKSFLITGSNIVSEPVVKLIETNRQLVSEVISLQKKLAEKDDKLIRIYERYCVQSLKYARLENEKEDIQLELDSIKAQAFTGDLIDLSD